MKDQIVEINEKDRLYVIEEIELDGKKYLFGPMMDNDEPNMERITIVQLDIVEGVGYIKSVDSPEILKNITEKITNRNP